MLFKMIKWFEGTVIKLNIESFKKQQRPRSQDNSSTWHLQRGSNKSNIIYLSKWKIKDNLSYRSTWKVFTIGNSENRLKEEEKEVDEKEVEEGDKCHRDAKIIRGNSKHFLRCETTCSEGVRYCHRIHRNSPVASSRFSRRNSSPPPLSPPPRPLSPLLLLLSLPSTPPPIILLNIPSYCSKLFSLTLFYFVYWRKKSGIFSTPLSLSLSSPISWCLLWQIYSFEIQEIYVNAWNLYQCISI